MLKIAVLETGPLSVNTYVLHSEPSSECVVIDPADGVLVEDYLNKEGLNCKYILLTHGHFDHLLGVEHLKRVMGAKVLIHDADKDALTSDKINLAAFVGTTTRKCEADRLLSDGENLNLCGIDICVMHTPGHSSGSVCYIIESEKVIFSGDTLFRLSVGRTDLYRSNREDLSFSILYKLYALHGNYTVLPGHGERTELEFERRNNPVTNHMDYE
ncbi:MAG: MBL fold metallo-hydrolase [Clostridia bacterium]|nr:MBL fold metallo-hydrolase [Clostridia bacterium]